MPLPEPSPAIRDLTAYRVPRHPAPLDLHLDGNEGLSAPADLLACLADADADTVVRRYPSPKGLEAVLAGRLGVAPGRVIATCGGDDALDRCCRALLAPGRRIVLPEPSFEMIRRYATWAGATIASVPWPGGPYPVDAVLEAVDDATTLVSVVTPNNPTGAVATADDLRRLAEGAPHAVLLVDLAYGEFADEDLTAAALALPNAVVFRTLSKAWGLAGLRIGYAAGPARLVDWMRAAGNPYVISGPSLHLAAHRLRTAQPEVDAFVARVRQERAALEALLAAHGFDVEPSQANFVFARSPRAGWVRAACAGLGIGLRGWPGHPELDDALRITCPGDDAAFQRLVDALDTALAPEALLLDVDGVIADVSGSYRQAILDTAASFGVPLTRDDVSEAKAEGDANNDWILTRRLLARAGVDAPLDEVTARFERLYQGTEAVPGLKARERLLLDADTLARWAADRPIAAVTGRPRADAAWFLGHHGVAASFRTAVCMEDGPAKPDPAPVHEALHRLGVARAWMVGDTVDDVRAARAAGVVPVGVVAPGEDRRAVEPVLLAAGAAVVLDHVGQLEELLP